MPSLHTDPALSARRRPLKPLLAEVLTGEPWLAALRDPRGLAPSVTAACVASYLSRRHGAWETVHGAELGAVLAELIAHDRCAHAFGDWPFLDALEALLPVLAWDEVEPQLMPYRQAVIGDGKICH